VRPQPAQARLRVEERDTNAAVNPVAVLDGADLDGAASSMRARRRRAQGRCARGFGGRSGQRRPRIG